MISRRPGVALPVAADCGGVRFLLLASVVLVFLALAPVAQASKGIVGYIGGTSGSAGGQLLGVRGVAVNNGGAGGVPAGTIYVVDSANNRISQFDPAGDFVRAWGEDVVASGEDQADATLAIIVDATGGDFTLTYGGSSTAEISATATAVQVESALNSLSAINEGGGSVTVTGGPGDVGGSNPYLVTFDAGPLAGSPQSLIAADGATPLSGGSSTVTDETTNAGETGFEICNANSDDVCQAGAPSSADGGMNAPQGIAVDQTNGDLYVTDEKNDRVDEFSATGSFIRSFGREVVVAGPDKAIPTSAVQTLTVTATDGDYELGFGGQATPELSYDATAGEVQAALTALTSLGAGNAEVTETAPGVYEIRFSGGLENNPEPLISASSAAAPNELTGGSASVVGTTVGSTGFSICAASRGDVCGVGTSAPSAGAFRNARVEPFASYPAVAPAGSPNAGDLLVPDPANHRLEEFTSTGAFVRAFGFNAVKAGPDNSGTGFEICSASAGDACEFGASGSETGQFGSHSPARVAENSTGAIYTVEGQFGDDRVQEFTPQVGPPALMPMVFGSLGAPDGSSSADAPTDIGIGAANDVFVVKAFEAGATAACPDGSPSIEGERRIQELSADGSSLLGTDLICSGVPSATGLAIDPGGDIYLASTGLSQLQEEEGDTESPRVYLLDDTGGAPSATIESITPETTGATVVGSVNPNGPSGFPNPPETSYVVQYKLASATEWTQFGERVNAGASTTNVPIVIHLGGLEANSDYQVRIVASKEYGEGVTTTPPEDFATLPVPPTIDSTYSSDVTASSAVVHARINPNGADTTCIVEYGSSANYSASVPCEPEGLGSATTDQTAEARLEGLVEGTTYHFRFVATNNIGTVDGEDQTFSFSPPACPNSHIRQQTGTQYLPDCRAYELVSPENAGGTTLYPEGPNSPLATDPSRFSFGGVFGKVPGAGPAEDDLGDLYVSTRTTEGWVTRYVGIPSEEAAEDSGPPLQNDGAPILDSPRGVLTDLSMDKFLDWNDGDSGFASRKSRGSFAPYLWTDEGGFLGRLPTNAEKVPGATELIGVGDSDDFFGASLPSPEFTHYFFSSAALGIGGNEEAATFAPGGQHEPPGSAYDDNLSTGTVQVISVTPSGGPIPPNSGQYDEEISFPGSSTDGSHVLMSTSPVETCLVLTNDYCPDPNTEPVPRQLYMRIDDAVTYEIAPGHDVEYVGMTADGSKVYFISTEQLTSDDHDASADLYMWSAAKAEEGKPPLTLISKGDNAGNPGEPGNTDECNASWTAKCGVVAFSTGAAPSLTPAFKGTNADLAPQNGVGGNGISDNDVASENGDIYFYSPELLDGSKGIENQQNLYDYRDGRVQYVTTFAPGRFCNEGYCSGGPMLRIQVSPNDSHMAFLTADQITSYNNAGHTEMYSYNPSTERIICVSCIPDGSSPASNVEASLDGLFMTNDGRIFFSTGDSLVPQDTDGIRDVYEYVEGRPQLISSGTSANDEGSAVSFFGAETLSVSGLVGVSANGTDVYFSTYDTLVGQDHNGNTLKFYDARTDGGFPASPEPPPCEAADECHGSGSGPPVSIGNATGAELGAGGNLPLRKAKKHPKKHRRARKHHRKAARKPSRKRHRKDDGHSKRVLGKDSGGSGR